MEKSKTAPHRNGVAKKPPLSVVIKLRDERIAFLEKLTEAASNGIRNYKNRLAKLEGELDWMTNRKVEVENELVNERSNVKACKRAELQHKTWYDNTLDWANNLKLEMDKLKRDNSMFNADNEILKIHNASLKGRLSDLEEKYNALMEDRNRFEVENMELKRLLLETEARYQELQIDLYALHAAQCTLPKAESFSGMTTFQIFVPGLGCMVKQIDNGVSQ